ncbi:MAG: phosphotransferase [Candidatus Micrarchaeota archaeon]|nr:phosphotransferase [Candidatus Micrarchaeota archaeon]MDE1824085.1 phosphotransferase [Candidatus Micrarchaeota archaeon]MDE1849348.1 phosphotransferase [Candidatus Micrarchaeota archaeon]
MTQGISANGIRSVTAGSAAELRLKLAESGVSAEKAFFKLLRKDFVVEGVRCMLAGSHEYDYSGLQMVTQFGRLLKMHAAIPGYVPEPFFRIADLERRCIGYAMEYVDGRPLSEYLRQGKLDELRGHMHSVENVMRRLHENAIAHGDIHWDNVIVTNDGRTVMIDPESLATATFQMDRDNLRDMRGTMYARMERLGFEVRCAKAI